MSNLHQLERSLLVLRDQLRLCAAALASVPARLGVEQPQDAFRLTRDEAIRGLSPVLVNTFEQGNSHSTRQGRDSLHLGASRNTSLTAHQRKEESRHACPTERPQPGERLL